jgi:ATP/maltotriose-dependent transcriptional regulator MalT
MDGAPAAEVGSLAAAALTGHPLPEGAVQSHLVYDALAALWATDRVEDTTRVHDAALAGARRCGSVLAFARASTFRAQLRLRRGALREAESDARAALDAADPDWPITRLALGALVEVLVERGRFDEAGRELAARDGDGDIPFTFMAAFLLWARCRLGIARGTAAGVEDLGEFARREQTWPGRSPVWFPHRALLASALLVRGRREEAVRLAEEEVGLARRWGAAAVVGAALRGYGLVRGGADGIATLRSAVDVLAGSPARLEHARAAVDLGVALRRAGQQEPARDQLATGLDLATVCGADALGERARDELRATGARPRRDRSTGPSALTAAELRVARMAADGMSNTEIAQSLFVTLRTVQLHLTHVYRKLGIASRDELEASLGAGETLRPAP